MCIVRGRMSETVNICDSGGQEEGASHFLYEKLFSYGVVWYNDIIYKKTVV